VQVEQPLDLVAVEGDLVVADLRECPLQAIPVKRHWGIRPGGHDEPQPFTSTLQQSTELVEDCWVLQSIRRIENENGPPSGPEQQRTMFIDSWCGADHRKRRICGDGSYERQGEEHMTPEDTGLVVSIADRKPGCRAHV
jgi:hypothetical protein